MYLKRYINNPINGAQRLRDYVQDKMVESNIWGGQKEYTKFIILGFYRTGSNFLVSSLNSHSQAVVFSELFFPRKIYWANGIYGRQGDQKDLMELRKANPEMFINKHVYRRYASGIKAVGFKIFYPQIEDPTFANLSDLLLSDPGIKVVHLKRQNVLHILVSGKIAEMTGSMSQVSAKKAEKKLSHVAPIELSYEECLEGFNRITNFKRKYTHLLKELGVSTLEIQYESLSSNPSGVIEKTQSFLNLNVQRLHSPLVKQNRRPISDSLENYESLKTQFLGSEWEYLFE